MSELPSFDSTLKAKILAAIIEEEYFRDGIIARNEGRKIHLYCGDISEVIDMPKDLQEMSRTIRFFLRYARKMQARKDQGEDLNRP